MWVADAGYAGGFGYAGGTDREGQAVVHGECPKELAGFLRQAAFGREPAESCFVRLQCETVVCLVEGEFAQLPGIRCEGRLSSAAAGRGGEYVGTAVGESGISAGVSYAGGQAGQPYGGVLLVAYEPGTERDAGHGYCRVYTQRHTVGQRIDGIRLCVREYLPCTVGTKYSHEVYELASFDTDAGVRHEPVNQVSLFYDNHIRISPRCRCRWEYTAWAICRATTVRITASSRACR